MILKRYILKEHISPFFLSLLVVTFILLIDRVMDLLNMIIEKQLDAATVLELFALSLPYMLALSIPMAVLVATILAFGRMSVDKEIVAMKTSGVNIYSMIGPLMVVAVLLTGLMVYFNHQFLPNQNHKLKNLMVKIAYYKPMTIIEEGEFTNVLDYTIFAKENQESVLRDVVIYDRSQTRFPRVLFADTGEIFQMDKGNSLQILLKNGQMHERNERDQAKYQLREFESFTVNIRNISNEMDFFESGYRSDREMTEAQLRASIRQKADELSALEASNKDLMAKLQSLEAQAPSFARDNELRRFKITHQMNLDKIGDARQSLNSLKVEYHKKFSLSFAIIIFVLIGIPLGLMTRSSGIGMAFSVSSVIFLIYYVALNGGEQLADRGLMSPFFSMWVSNIVFLILALLLIYASIKEKHIIDLPQLIWKLKNIKRKKAVMPEELKY